VYDAGGNVVASAFSGNSAPRVATMPVPPDGTNYTVQVVPFNPEGFSYTATAQLIPKPVFTAPPPNPAAARFQTYLSPGGMGENAGEPSIGIDWNANDPSLRHGTVNTGGVSFYQSGPNTLRISFDDCSSPAADTWDDVSTPLVQQFVFSDPIGWTDPMTGRVFSLDLIGFQGDSFMATSDDDGTTWLPSQGGGVPQGGDHETLGGGPYHAPIPDPAPVYPNAIYYCSQNIAPEAECSRSDDGGKTFGPGVPIYQTTDCVSSGSIHGHVKVGPDGTVYVPSASCAIGPGIAISHDNGITWSFGHPPNQTNWPSLVDPSVAIDAANTVYLVWLDGNTNHPYVSVSHDEGGTWSAPFDVGAVYGIQNANFVISTAGDANRAAVGFIGTTVTGNPQSATFPGIWDLYIATTYDGGATWTTRDATPGDPVQLGCVWTSGGSNPCRNLLDFNDMRVDSQGRIEVAFAKGCLASANCTLATASQHGAPYPESVASKAAVVRQSGGMRMFARFDPPTSAPPANPRLDSATVDP
ncbi:MAG TPA: sialidase family protein, partial [Thermoanaerobaculia bacterium]|nr:sialidase family protein [Thermoanaerobaculia bacterium]